MKIYFAKENKTKHYDHLEEEAFLVTLDEYWMKRRNQVLFKLCLDKVIKKRISNGKNADSRIISKDQVLVEYNKVSPFIPNRNWIDVLKYIFERPTYLILLLSSILTTICFVGRLFLYGYYFGKGTEDFTGLLGLFINPVPIDVFSSAFIGVFIAVYILILLGLVRYLTVKSENTRLWSKFAISLILLTIVSTVMFTNFTNKPMAFIGTAALLYMIVPFVVVFMLLAFHELTLKPLNFYLSMLLYYILVVALIIYFIDDKDITNMISTLQLLFMFPFIYTLSLLLRKKLPDKKRDSGMDLADLRPIEVVEYEDFKTASLSRVVSISTSVLVTLFFGCALIYGMGSIYSNYPGNTQYSLISFNANSSVVSNQLIGTIIGEKGNAYYIATSNKELVILKTNNVTTRSCEYLKNPSSDKKFQEEVNSLRNELTKKFGDSLQIKYVPQSDNIMAHHEIMSENEEYKIYVYYSTNFMNELSKVLIKVEAETVDVLGNSDVKYLKNIYLNFFNFNESEAKKHNVYYQNGILTYGMKKNRDSVEETILFKCNEIL